MAEQMQPVESGKYYHASWAVSHVYRQKTLSSWFVRRLIDVHPLEFRFSGTPEKGQYIDVLLYWCEITKDEYIKYL